MSPPLVGLFEFDRVLKRVSHVDYVALIQQKAGRGWSDDIRGLIVEDNGAAVDKRMIRTAGQKVGVVCDLIFAVEGDRLVDFEIAVDARICIPTLDSVS